MRWQDVTLNMSPLAGTGTPLDLLVAKIGEGTLGRNIRNQHNLVLELLEVNWLIRDTLQFYLVERFSGRSRELVTAEEQEDCPEYERQKSFSFHRLGRVSLFSRNDSSLCTRYASMPAILRPCSYWQTRVHSRPLSERYVYSGDDKLLL